MFGGWPIGSANDFAYTLGMDVWWQRHMENPPTEVLTIDVGRDDRGTRRRSSCNLGVGFNGMVNGGSPKDAPAQGAPLYAWAFIKSMVKHFGQAQR